MRDVITLPGIGGSGGEHWQSRWEAAEPGVVRFAPASWDEPELGNWMAALDLAVSEAMTPPVLVAHSLACLLVAHWQARSVLPVAGAMLVAVPDPDAAAFPVEAKNFEGPPETQFRFPSIIVASGDDPYGAPGYARLRAAQWGSRLIEVGNFGHINGASGLGAWRDGRAMLADFMGELAGA